MTEANDVIIVGAGPAGMAAAIYTGRARLKTIILEKGMPGGQILLTDFVENYPGFPEGVVPFELMDNFRKHAEKFGAKIETDEVKKIRKEKTLWYVLGNKGEYPGRTVIVASGSSYRKLGLPGEARLIGRGVSYCGTCDGAFFKDMEVVVVGGGDHALTEALFLTKFCSSVKIIHRRDKFRGEKIIQERIFANEKIEVLWDSVIEEIKGEDKLESISIRNVKDETTQELKINGLFVSVGMDPNSSFVKGLLDLDEDGQIRVDLSMATSLPGIFAAGDVTNACPEQMATAVGTGVAAALAVDSYLSRQETP
ncbi:MAG: thioredoxin-disulfide reductase [Candidatus Aminicenantes bacterium]|nr:MAG: thioredoxin-disulfide reductase [Candidatus Aminicenantes bacterium]